MLRAPCSCSRSCFLLVLRPRASCSRSSLALVLVLVLLASRHRVSPAVGTSPLHRARPGTRGLPSAARHRPNARGFAVPSYAKQHALKNHPASRERKHRDHNTSQAGPISAPSRSRLLIPARAPARARARAPCFAASRESRSRQFLPAPSKARHPRTPVRGSPSAQRPRICCSIVRKTARPKKSSRIP